MPKSTVTPEQIDALLPQTQCGLCGYPGCMPYATALQNNTAEINLCPPGGVKGLLALAHLLNKDPTPYITQMEKITKPPLRAVIREAECIGCTKCIQACPVDAILGSAKHMHTVIASECTGCELCIAPCPVDCIDLLVVEGRPLEKKSQYRNRYQARQKRLLLEKQVKPKKFAGDTLLEDKKAYVAAAISRAKMKKRTGK